MNHVKIAFAAFSMLLLAAFVSCQKSDDNSPGGNNNNVTPAAGQWKVTYFFDKKDETGNYTGYTFEFGANGSLAASNGNQTWTGTWQTGIDDSADKFLIDFTGVVPSALLELEEDWRIITIEDNFMHFEHTSGGNGDTDVLKFTKS
ncbi:MAG: hypothetical protein DYG98_02375 [Haliscomenobacteraceae bacterium CHB4]|nr:hypothetical protein [Saprospiraceae bacterium]MCE7921878.1 hypothetical protein [Haliscomenobacteraceae bacterium CHB4]